jgi:hypothetical protein
MGEQGSAMVITDLFLLAAVLAAVQPSSSPMCALHPSGGKWQGSCDTLVEGEKISLSIAPAAAITSGTWRRGETPTAVWAGTITAGEEPATPVEIEVYGDATGAMRTLFGWFAVSRFTPAKDLVGLDLDASHEVPPSAIDREIVERANGILSSAAVWNRADNRKCPAVAATWSIFCAMEKATVEVAGAFHHRRPALQVVRAIVDERSANRPYQHRLMDYNNDPTTQLGDVRTLFAEALKRIDAAMAPKGGERPTRSDAQATAPP